MYEERKTCFKQRALPFQKDAMGWEGKEFKNTVDSEPWNVGTRAISPKVSKVRKEAREIIKFKE